MGLRALTYLAFSGPWLEGCAGTDCRSGPAGLDLRFDEGAVIPPPHFDGADTPAVELRVTGTSGSTNIDVSAVSVASESADGWAPDDLYADISDTICMFPASVTVALVDDANADWVAEEEPLTLLMADLDDSARVPLVDDIMISLSWSYWIF